MGQVDLLPLSLNFWKNLQFQESEPESLHHCHTAWKDILTGQQGMSIPCSPPQQLSRSPNTSLHNLNLRFPQLWMLKPHCEHFLLLNCPEGKRWQSEVNPIYPHPTYAAFSWSQRQCFGGKATHHELFALPFQTAQREQ